MRDREMSFWNSVSDASYVEDRLTIIPYELCEIIKSDKYKSIIEKIRGEPDKEKRSLLKKSLKAVTISGVFKERKKESLVSHSGLICLDFDGIKGVEQMSELLREDKLVFCCFKSVSGSGLAVVVKIEPHRHTEAFEALAKRFFERYGLVADVGCKDVSRLRFLSYDPDVYLNTSSELFTKIPKPEKPKRHYPAVAATNTDIGKIVSQASERGLDITDGSYAEWMRLGASMVSIGEPGRAFFHALSANHQKYRPEQTDKMFDNLSRTANGSITTGTFFYYARRAGLEINTEKQKKITEKCRYAKKTNGKTTLDDVIKNLSGDGIICLPEDGETAALEDVALVKNVYENTPEDDSPGIQEIENYILGRWKIKKNEISNSTEWAETGIGIEDRDYADIYIETKKEYPLVKKNDVIDIIESKAELYNPLKNFIRDNRNLIDDVKIDGSIKKMADCLVSSSGLDGEIFDTEYEYHYIRKWLIGMIASVYGHVSPLLLALVGKQNTGKTNFLRNLLPEELRKYSAEIKLGIDKDSAMDMATYLVIIDDELSGKSRMEEKHLKELTSRDIMTFRPPYGRKSIRRKRLAVLCGTTNDEAILNDPTGNRRIIPIKVDEIRFEELNAIDRKHVFMEAVKLYESGEQWNLTHDEIVRLGKNTTEYVQECQERELVQIHYPKPEDGLGTFRPISMILHDLEMEYSTKLNIRKLGIEFRAAKFDSFIKKINGKAIRGYMVSPRNFKTTIQPLFL